MKANTIIHRYVFCEMIGPFVVNLVFFALVFLTTQMLDIIHMMINSRIDPKTVILLLVYVMPYFLVFVIPMSVMMGVLLGFLRLSNDNEIIALKSGGIGIYHLLPPVLVFSFIGMLLTAWMAMVGMPWGKSAFERLTIDAVASNLRVAVKEGTFMDDFADVMLYVDKIDPKKNILYNIFIEDQRHGKVVGTIVSPRGELYTNPSRLSFGLKLYDGAISQVDMNQKTSNSIEFKTYELSLDLKETASAEKNRGKKDVKEMSMKELTTYLKTRHEKDTRYYKALIELHNRFSIPAACLVLGILAIPLGVQSRAARKSYGLGLGLAFFLLYYLLLSLGWVLGKSGIYPPLVGSWVPNIVMGVIGIFLLKRTAMESPIGFFALFERMGQTFIKRIRSVKA
jgi:lipopolysaccharide export system permease protein